MILPPITFLIHPKIFRFQQKILRSKKKILIFEDSGLLLVLLSPVWGLESTLWGLDFGLRGLGSEVWGLRSGSGVQARMLSSSLGEAIGRPARSPISGPRSELAKRSVGWRVRWLTRMVCSLANSYFDDSTV